MIARVAAIALALGLLFGPSAITATRTDDLFRHGTLGLTARLSGVTVTAGTERTDRMADGRQRTCARFRPASGAPQRLPGRWLCVRLRRPDEIDAVWTAARPGGPPIRYLIGRRPS